jgi:threonine/homoserine/homoserine lactone efflux protein
MTQELLFGLVGFAFALSITPGPNNLMLMASGANCGLLRTLPHMLGISLGHGFMVFLMGLGLVRLFESYPNLRLALTVLCSAYLLWLAWKIANAAPPPESDIEGTPLTFLQAAAFQWVNPKAIYMAITAQTYYAPQGGGWIGAALVAGVFSMTNLPSVSVWAWLGVQMKRILGTGRLLRAFNITMALLLVATLIPLLQG